MKRACQRCGTRFEPIRDERICSICSSEKIEPRAPIDSAPGEVKHICLVCGKAFTPKSKKQKVCSSTCSGVFRSKHWKERHKRVDVKKEDEEMVVTHTNTTDEVMTVFNPRFIENDDIYHPSHYTSGKIETKDAQLIWNLSGFLTASVKYLSRAGKKLGNTKEKDLQKAKAYIQFEMERIQACMQLGVSSEAITLGEMDVEDCILDWGLTYFTGMALKLIVESSRKDGEVAITILKDAILRINKEITGVYSE